MFDKQTVVINYKRKIIYFFDPDNPQHRREYFSCREATIVEASQFRKLQKEVATFKEIGFNAHYRQVWKDHKGVLEPIFLNKSNILKLNKIARLNDFNSYSQVIELLLKNFELQKENLLTEITSNRNDEKFLLSIFEKLKKTIDHELLLFHKRKQ